MREIREKASSRLGGKAIEAAANLEGASTRSVPRGEGVETEERAAPAVRVLLISPMITPYRNPLFNALARSPGISLRVIHLCRRHRREWDLHLDEIEHPFTILTHHGLRHEGLTWGGLLPRRMAREPYHVVIVPGYSHPAYLQAMLYARLQGKKVVLWSESTALDRRTGGRVREIVKRAAVGICDEFIVPGSAAREYVERLGAPADRIHTVGNSVDNAFFRDASESCRRDRETWRRRFGLPPKVILFVGRVERWKGVGDLLAAHRGLPPGDQVGLVLAGSGPGLDSLRRRALCRGWRGVFFPGFVPRDRLPPLYSVADLFVLPTWHDSWGLVVNEAMASGLPVVVSSVAGAARDLVEDGRNGYVYAVRDVGGLKSAMETILSRPDLQARMGEASRRIIARFTPEASARALAEALVRIAGRGGQKERG